MSSPDVLTIGSDPEFLIFEDGHPVAADRFLEGGTYSKVGCDGYSFTGEIRPSPSENPISHINGVETLLKRALAETVQIVLVFQTC